MRHALAEVGFGVPGVLEQDNLRAVQRALRVPQGSVYGSGIEQGGNADCVCGVNMPSVQLHHQLVVNVVEGRLVFI